MASRQIPYLLFIFFLQSLLTVLPAHSASSTNARTNPSANRFIWKSCQTARYRTLSPYGNQIPQNENRLVLTSLAVSLARARSTALYVSKLQRSVHSKYKRDYLAIKDCVDTMGDSVNAISKSIYELAHMDRSVGPEFFWHMSNVQTWVSAALTDAGTCGDGFRKKSRSRLSGRVKAAIRVKVNNVARVTSNALALVNRFADNRMGSGGNGKQGGNT